MSFFYENGQMVFTRQGRRVATTGGTLLQFITEEQVLSASLAYPDASKTQLHQWLYQITRAPGDQFSANRQVASAVGAMPQEWSNTVVLGSVPAGADLFMGRVTLTRTKGPSHAWLGQSIVPIIPTGVPLGVAGATSIILEGALGITRAVHFDVIPGNPGQFVAILQHSVGPAAGNFGTGGTIPIEAPPQSIPGNNYRTGYQNIAAGGPALPVLYLNTGRSETQETSGVTGGRQAVNYVADGVYGGSAQAAYSDPTDYSSIYSATVQVRFGRRS